VPPDVDPRPSATAAAEAALAAIEARDDGVRAFASVDPAAVRAAAAAVDAAAATGRAPQPLRGVTVAVKDVIDTADLPTEHGSPIYAGRRPERDAASVAALRAAGAVIVGKAHTAELAGFHPPPTTNPHRATHTPGGSSSGSAAAVAAGMATAALGTQTAGSVLRPAAFCGVVGYKPTFGTISRNGVLAGADSLDTVGVLATSVADAAAVAAVAAGRPSLARPGTREPRRVGLLRPTGWERADRATHAAVAEAAAALAGGGAPVAWDAPAWYADALDDHRVVMRWEVARAFAWERAHHWDALSAEQQEMIGEGLAVSEERMDLAVRRRRASAVEVARWCAAVDVIVLPAAPGEAPEGLGSTGDPVFLAPWTFWGHPAVSVPWGDGSTGLPLGVQLVGARGADAALLAAAARLEELAPPRPVAFAAG